MKEKKEVVLITGGASGIGKETAKGFLKLGLQVVIADIQQNQGNSTVEELSHLGAIDFFYVDLLDEKASDALIPSVVDKHGRLDILVNNAGIPNRSPIPKVTREEFDQVFNLHVKSVFFLSQIAAEQMKKQNKGVIINISSIRSIRPDCLHPLYGISKSTVRSLTEHFAYGLSRFNIRVNAISPGLVITPMTEHHKDKPDYREMIEISPFGYDQSVETIVDTILFLASDQSMGITGQTIEADMGTRFVNILNKGQYDRLNYPKKAK